MGDMMNSARSIRNLATLYRDMEAAAATLESIGSVEQAKRELEASVAQARTDLDGLIKARDEAKAEYEASEKQAQVIVAKAIASAEEIVEGSKKGAEVQAAEIIKAGQDEAAGLVAQASLVKAQLSSEIGGLQKSVTDLKAEIADLQRAKTDAETQRAKVQAQLDTLKGNINALLG